MRRYALSVLLLAATAGGLSGCVPDQNQEDYNRQKLTEELSKLEPIRGTFRGVLKAASDSETLGALELTFSPQIKVVPGGASMRADGRPVLNARLQFEDRENKLAASVTDSYFDPETGRFQLTLAITRAAGRTEEMTLGGILNSDTLSGELTIASLGTHAGTFSLKRAGNSGSLTDIAQKLSTKPWFTAPSSSRDGITRFATGQERLSRIVILDPETTPEEAFLNRFAPVRVVQFTLNYGDSVKLVNENAIWDERTRVLSGKAKMGTFEVITHCSSPDAASWSCTHEVAGVGETATSEFAPTFNRAPPSDGSDLARTAAQWTRAGVIESQSKRITAVWLQATRPTRTRSEDLADLFNPSPETSMTVTLQFGIPDSKLEDRITVAFENARYDERALTLDARAQIRSSSSGSANLVEVSLHCSNLSLEGLAPPTAAPTQATCFYSSNQLSSPLTLKF
jgi:hypothetical protein